MGTTAISGQKAYDIKISQDKLLGEGSFGNVYQIKRKETGKVYAAKFFKVPPEMMSC